MKVQHTVLINGKHILATDGAFGWALDKKQIIGFEFDSLGGHGESVYRVLDESAFEIAGSHCLPGSQMTRNTTTVKMVDESTITSQKTDITVGDVKQPDEEVLTWKRKK